MTQATARPLGETLPPDLQEELARFEARERARLGLHTAADAQWRDAMVDASFTKAERPRITLLVGGLTLAHDALVEQALSGLGYNVRALPCPDEEALRVGKEFGNRGQCNPTWFTVGNLVKELIRLRDEEGLSTPEIIDRYVFLTAGACGPCRFGMYVTEYRKALRDAGFDGFRVVLFQQTGGFSQATGEEAGLDLSPPFFIALVKALLAGDALNALAYRIRPYETEAGATDRALEEAKVLVGDALREHRSVLRALLRARRRFASVAIDPLRPRPKVSIIGEFWAMTTEGDGNYRLQRFLESEGAEVDIQLVTAWLLYMLWEVEHDTEERRRLRGTDGGTYGLEGIDPTARLATVFFAEAATRGLFWLFSRAVGLGGYHLPDMRQIARAADGLYDQALRGGEGHMEVAKLVLNVKKRKSHMTLSVKPFGCMPSSGVSDGVQSLVTAKLPEAIYCPVETSGDGAVNFYSRVQMVLFKARERARQEYAQALEAEGLGEEEVRAFLEAHPRYARALHHPPHRRAGRAVNLVHEVGPLARAGSPLGRLRVRAGRLIRRTGALVREDAPRAARFGARAAAHLPPLARSALASATERLRPARA